jgi:hypothetical protein
MEATQEVRGVGGRASRAVDLDLRELSKLDVDALGELYAKGAHPTRVDGLEGNPRGRMLAIRALDHGPLAGVLRAFAGARTFPWGGKTFTGTGPSGAGSNRVHLLGRHQLFPFHTSIRPSVIDGEPCIVLDYDLPDNPWAIRMIHDEVREVAPGLFLGPAMWKTDKGPAFVLWFALDTREQSNPIGYGRDLV